ncbi:MAG: DUF2065 domain-containing protein [Gammaproteobacteria bacterium]
MLEPLLIAIGLVFIFEGLTPFLAPRLWRRMMQQLLMQDDKTLRVFGFISMIIGLGLVYWIR